MLGNKKRSSSHRSSDRRFIHLAWMIPCSVMLASCGGGYAHKGSIPLAASAGAAYASDSARESIGGESYDAITENQFRDSQKTPLSTFSIDVDTAAYSNVRRFLDQGQLPPKDAVRIEELINYFDYQYPEPQGDAPFAVVTEVAPAPWHPTNQLIHIGLQGKRVDTQDMPPRNLVFLLDVSGSMGSQNKLPLLKRSLALLVDQLDQRDRVAIVVYAGASGTVLDPTPGHRKQDILQALRNLSPGGGTNGAAGIQLAYQLAEKNFQPGAINRVILATDGDFNVGVTDRGDLTRLIEQKRKSGVFLTVLGLGMGNLKDSTMEQLADKGNGSYAYIDSMAEARKVLVDELGGTLLTIAKDVKIQVHFNPARVASYRLIGYENRLLADSDFDDDSKDAGEIGAGHTVTALYEIALTEPAQQAHAQESASASADSLATVRLRYKRPDSDQSVPMKIATREPHLSLLDSSEAFRFSAAVAGFGMLLRDSENAGDLTFAQVLDLAASAMSEDRAGYRRQFTSLVEKARSLKQPGSVNRVTRAN